MNHAILNVDFFFFGDSGKGTTVEYQTKKTNSKLTVRFNGGAQAAHNIVLKDGRHHTFSQFGSATFEPGVKTYLSEFVLVNPLAMDREVDHLFECDVKDAYSRIYINREALLTTPYHRADNRIKELYRGGGMHGSCGMGISATVEDSINRPDECLKIKDLENPHELLRKLKLNRLAMIESCKPFIFDNALVDRELSTFDDVMIDVIYNRFLEFRKKVQILGNDEVSKLFNETETVVFEPAQGVLLDENYGFHPYTTWTTCTMKNARTILYNLGYKGSVETYGVLRTFATRHGPGPFVTENKTELPNILNEPYNKTNVWQKNFRFGYLDLVALKYSLGCNGSVNYLSVTHEDTLSKKDTWPVCVGYKLNNKDWVPFIPQNMSDQIKLTDDMEKVIPVYKEYSKNEILNLLSETLNTKIKIVSKGPTYEDKYEKD